ncbi:MAG: hypothetical protein JJE13_13565 [Thermoleophilia bacterium]|nr:hypothetical protein [Thermoleophilia bacterium]
MTGRQSKRRHERRKAHVEKTRQGSRFGQIALGTGVGMGAALAMAAPASAQDFTVTALNDSGTGSLRAAIDDANTNTNAGSDRILFQSGLTGSIGLQSELVVSDDLEIEGPGADAITVDGHDTFGLFSVENPAATMDFTLSGLTLFDGSSQYYGGGIDAVNTNLTVNDSVLYSNNGQVGGAIYSGGNGQVGSDGSLTVDHSTLSGNTSGLGGAIAASGNITVSYSTFDNNRALQGGGAITASGSQSDSTLTINQSTFNRNSGAFTGGAVAVIPGPYSEVDLSVQSSTISGNQAGFAGGGIAGGFTDADIENSVIENNFAYYGPDLYSGTFAGVPGGGCGCYPETTFDSMFSFIGETADATINSTVAGSNILDTGDALLGSLADNGGSTRTMAIGPDSPVANKGASALTVDQRDEKRPVEYPNIANSTAPGANGADMGAFELQYEEPPPPPPPVIDRPFLLLGSTPHRKKGTATVRVKIPAAGAVNLVGYRIFKSSKRHFAAKGVYKFEVVPKGKNLKKKLNKTGKAKVLVKFRYTPDVGRTLAKGRLFPLFKGTKSKKAKPAALREWRSLGGPGN